ncbi:hypothetical protein [Caballeronia sp.]|uniref:hypothetical protein n=1 Tax=Caballeronia sp. TaxID=1931223 RepID=UPI003C3C8700
MNRFPRHYHETGKEESLTCFDCGQTLTEVESEHYWSRFPDCSFDPRCFDCASQLEVEELEPVRPKPSSRVLSSAVMASSLGLFIMAAFNQHQAAYFIGAALFCLNLGVLMRICKR